MIVIRPHTLQIVQNLAVVLADMRRIPTVTARVIVREGGGVALECRVSGAHDGLAHVGDAVNHVPVVVVWNGVAGGEARIGLCHGEEAVNLVCHGGRENGHTVVPLDGLGEIMVFVGIIDPLEAHTLCATDQHMCSLGVVRYRMLGITYWA